MSDELKHCPFCGGAAKAFYCEESGTFDVQCQQCGAIPFIGSRTSERKTVADVIAAWNARAAVTDEQFSMAVHDGRAWQVVRECRNVGEETDDDFKCSLCGESYNESDDMAMPASRIDWCFSCGAKVVG